MQSDYKEITETIIGCAFSVYNKMGFGYFESVYEKCLIIELAKTRHKVESQKAIDVFYERQLVGEFKADIIVDDTIIVELKSVKKIVNIHEAQLVNYLVATGRPIGLLINFGEERVEIRRKVRELYRFFS